MKLKCRLVLTTLLFSNWSVRAEDAFIYDQQATNIIEGAGAIRAGEPMGQSFTPALSSVGVIELNLFDSDAFDHSGATVYVNLRSNSITGNILGASPSVYMPGHFFGITNFFFLTPVAVTPGLTYYFQPVIQSGNNMSSYITDGSYAGGSAIYQGVPIPDRNLWFREGIIIPEPSSAWLVLMGGGVLLYVRRFKCLWAPVK